MLRVLLLLASTVVTLSLVPEDDDRIIDLQELLLNVSKAYNNFQQNVNQLGSEITNIFHKKFITVIDDLKGNCQKLNENVEKHITNRFDAIKTLTEENLNLFVEKVMTAVERVEEITNVNLNHTATIMERLSATNDGSEQSHKKPRDCMDIFLSGKKADGIYRVWPEMWGLSGSFEVLCDMTTAGGGWTVFQKRGDFGFSNDFFFKTWNEYKIGFGDLTKEFWLGNDRLFALTNQDNYKLRVDVWEMNNNTAFAQYDKFWIENEDQLYRLNMGGYNGTAGDSLAWQNTMRFTTKDRDNDLYEEGNCADLYKGGWWYIKCHGSNLNGLNLKGPHESYADGIIWSSWKGAHYSLFSQMKIRPTKHPHTS